MTRLLTGKQPNFRNRNSSSNTYRLLILLFLVVVGIFVLRSLYRKEIISPFTPTQVPTRTAQSYAMEGETRFIAGDLNGAITAYKQATQLEPLNANLWSELARIQVYSSNLTTTDNERRTRIQEALQSTEIALKADPESSTAYAIRALALDWYSDPVLSGDQAQSNLLEAEQAAVRALQMDNQNALALAYYAEILNDQQKWVQADQYIRQAIERDPNSMDAHRINAYVRETFQDYDGAIIEYQKAAQINPNLTFLYISIGLNYRQLKQYDRALENFDKAATINEQLGIKDPIPYIAIGKTYTQMGEFFIAARNMLKALKLNPYSPDLYGQLGIVYFQARNYETAIFALKCVVRGCTAQETCDLRECDPALDPQVEILPSPLTANTVVYYYTYGSVLTGMHRPSDDKCTEAVEVLQEVRLKFADDINVMPIVEANERVCASFGITYQGNGKKP
jgi:tetratricopeptide (TPR) repeat protein